MEIDLRPLINKLDEVIDHVKDLNQQVKTLNDKLDGKPQTDQRGASSDS